MLFASTKVANGCVCSSVNTTAALASRATAQTRVSRRNSRRIAGRACSSSVSG